MINLTVFRRGDVRAVRRNGIVDFVLTGVLLLMLLPQLAGCGASSVSLVGRLEGLRAERLAVAGSMVYVAEQDGLQIIDASDPENPHLLGSLTTPGHVDALAVDARGVYLSLRLAPGEDSATDATTRRWLAEGLITFGPNSLSVGSFSGASYFVIVNPGDGTQPEVVGVVDTTPVGGGFQATQHIVLGADSAYLVSETREVLAVDVSNPAAPQILGPVAPPSSHIEISGLLLYAAGRQAQASEPDGKPALPGGLQIFDISNLSDPQLLGGLDAEVLGGNAQQVLRNGRLIYLALSTAGGPSAEHYLVTIDVADPQRPQEIQRLKVEHAIDRLQHSAARLFLLHGSRISVLDITTPDAPAAAAYYDLQSALNLAEVRDETIDGFLVYIAAGDDGLLIARLEQ